MPFSPAGMAPDESRLSVSLEVSHVPSLNEAQRRPSIDKPESTNLAPFLPRPRGARRACIWTVDARVITRGEQPPAVLQAGFDNPGAVFSPAARRASRWQLDRRGERDPADARL